jgi:membrane associated rhomboid family serine protease
VLPIGDENAGTILKPIVNWALIAICVVVFLFQLTLSPSQLEAFFFQYGAVPADITEFRNLPSLLTSMFLHGGWGHLLGNMLFLYVFGDNIEDAMGHVSYLLFYLLCGIAAALTQILLSPDSGIPMIGASGAISGVMGAYLVLFPQGKVRAIVFYVLMLVPAWIVIGVWFVFQLVGGYSSLRGPDVGGVAFWAHVGGFIAGAILVWVFRDKDAVARQNAVREHHRSWQRVPAGGR